MRTVVRRVVLVLLAALVPVGALRAQDAPPAPPGIPKAGPRRPLPEDPPKKVGKDIETALQAFFELDPSTTKDSENIAARSQRNKSFGAIYEGMKAWNAKLTDDSCLRRLDWWKAALLQTYPTSEPKKKIYKEQVQDPLGGPPLDIVLNIPPGYRGKGGVLYPVILTLLEKDADPRKTLEGIYGPLLNSHIVVAVPEEAAGTNRFKLLRGLDFVLSRYRADHHRVTLDGPVKGPHFVDSLGAETAVLFNGVVFRAPTTISPVVGNLAFFPCAVALPPAGTEPMKQATVAIKTACPETTVIEGLGTPAADTAIQNWIAALPPRAIKDPTRTFSWWGVSLGAGQTWGYWTFVRRAVDAGADLPVMVRVRLDPEYNLVDIDARNLAIGIVLLNDDVLDLDQTIYIRVNGIVVLTQQAVLRDLSLLFGSDGLYNDPKFPRDLFATVALSFDVPDNARLTREERADLERQRKEAEEEMERQRKAAEEAQKPEEPVGEAPAGENPAPADAPVPADVPAPADAPAADPPADAPPAPPLPEWFTDFEKAMAAATKDGKVLVAFLKSPPGAAGETDPFQEALQAALQTPDITARLAAGCVRFETVLTPEALTAPLKAFLGEKAESVKAPLLIVRHPGEGGKRAEIGPSEEWKPEERPARLKAALEEALPAAPTAKPAPAGESEAPVKEAGAEPVAEPGAKPETPKTGEAKPETPKTGDAEPK